MAERPWSVRGVPLGASVAIERVCRDCGGRFMDSGFPSNLCPPCAHKPEHQRMYMLTWDGEAKVLDGNGNLVQRPADPATERERDET